MNHGMAQISNGEKAGNGLRSRAGLRGPSLVSNLFGPTFFSRTRPDVRETGPHKAFIAQRSGNIITGEKA